MKYFILLITVILFSGCKVKKTQEEKKLETETVEEKISVQIEDVKKETEPEVKINKEPSLRELDWYVGKWIEFKDYGNGWHEETPKELVELEIKTEGNHYTIVMKENGNVFKGVLYYDKIFLPKNLPAEEQAGYDSSDYLLADFKNERYWIGICYDGYKGDKISLNVDDIDVYCLTRESEKEVSKNKIEIEEKPIMFGRGLDWPTINDNGVRLRSQRNLDCEVIMVLKKGQKVRPYAKSGVKFMIDNEEWYWYKIITEEGTFGWVYGKYLDIEQ